MSKLKSYRVVRVVEEIFETEATNLKDAKKQINEEGDPHTVTVISEDWQVKNECR